MNYPTFCSVLTFALSACAGSETKITRQSVPKNNGVCLDALILKKAGSSCAPVIYLDPLYHLYQSGSPIESICNSVLSCLEQKLPFPPEICTKIQNLESVKDLIAFRLISRESNEALLKGIPWVPFLDLAIVFFLDLSSGPDGHATTLIHSHLASLWNTSADQLLSIARKNTPLLFPSVITRMEDLLPLPVPDSGSEDRVPALHILTNRSGLYGASCILYENAMKDFADRTASDVIILPSSIHEVLLLPDDHPSDYDSLCDIVQSVNASAVAKEDVLAGHIYLYTRCDRTIRMWPSAFCHKP